MSYEVRYVVEHFMYIRGNPHIIDKPIDTSPLVVLQLHLRDIVIIHYTLSPIPTFTHPGFNSYEPRALTASYQIRKLHLAFVFHAKRHKHLWTKQRPPILLLAPFFFPHFLNCLFGRHSEIRITLSHRQTLQLPFENRKRSLSIRVTRGNNTLYEAEQVFNYLQTQPSNSQEVEHRAHLAQVFQFILLNPIQFRTLPEKVQRLFQALQIRAALLIPSRTSRSTSTGTHCQHRDAVQLLLLIRPHKEPLHSSHCVTRRNWSQTRNTIFPGGRNPGGGASGETPEQRDRRRRNQAENLHVLNTRVVETSTGPWQRYCGILKKIILSYTLDRYIELSLDDCSLDLQLIRWHYTYHSQRLYWVVVSSLTSSHP